MSAEALETAHDGYERFQKLGHGLRRGQMPGQRSHGPQPARQGSAFARALRAGAAEIRARKKSRVAVADRSLSGRRALRRRRLFEARRLCSRAAEFFDASFLPGKAVLCHLLLARICLRAGDPAAAPRRMSARAQAAGKCRSSGAALSGRILDGPVSAGRRRLARRPRILPKSARSARNASQHPAWRRIENRLHEEPPGSLRVSRRTLHERHPAPRSRRRIVRLHGAREIPQPRRIAGPARPRRAGGRHGSEWAGSPHPRNARRFELVLPPNRNRAVKQGSSVPPAHRAATERGAGPRKRAAPRVPRNSSRPVGIGSRHRAGYRLASDRFAIACPRTPPSSNTSASKTASSPRSSRAICSKSFLSRPFRAS